MLAIQRRPPEVLFFRENQESGLTQGDNVPVPCVTRELLS